MPNGRKMFTSEKMIDFYKTKTLIDRYLDVAKSMFTGTIEGDKTIIGLEIHEARACYLLPEEINPFLEQVFQEATKEMDPRVKETVGNFLSNFEKSFSDHHGILIRDNSGDLEANNSKARVLVACIFLDAIEKFLLEKFNISVFWLHDKIIFVHKDAGKFLEEKIPAINTE